MNIEKRTIFYTDDDEDDQYFFKVAGGQVSATLQITALHNGDELINLLNNPPPSPDLIFLDLNMPGKTGLEVLKEIKRSSLTKHLPVIIFSTSDDAVSIANSRELGANMYIPKPTSINCLQKVIKHALSINWDTFSSNEEHFVFRIN